MNPELNSTTFVLGILIGAVLRDVLPRAWKQAKAADLEETALQRRARFWWEKKR